MSIARRSFVKEALSAGIVSSVILADGSQRMLESARKPS